MRSCISYCCYDVFNVLKVDLVSDELNYSCFARLPQLFDKLREEQPDFAEKIVPLNSDLTKPELDLSKQDQDTLKECINVVFHCAATIRFNEPLK